MSRKTVYNANLVTQEKWKKVNQERKIGFTEFKGEFVKTVLPYKAGVYLIIALDENDEVLGVYVGESNNMHKRENRHYSIIRTHNGHAFSVNEELYNKLGEANRLEYLVLHESDDKDERLDIESLFISYFRKKGIKVFNLTDKGDAMKEKRPVTVYRLGDKKPLYYCKSITEASLKTNAPRSSIIQCCKGFKRYSSSNGYVFRYGHEPYDLYDVNEEKLIELINEESGKTNIFKTTSEASKFLGASSAYINRMLNKGVVYKNIWKARYITTEVKNEKNDSL